jgi:hypothetical protein
MAAVRISSCDYKCETWCQLKRTTAPAVYENHFYTNFRHEVTIQNNVNLKKNSLWGSSKHYILFDNSCTITARLWYTFMCAHIKWTVSFITNPDDRTITGVQKSKFLLLIKAANCKEDFTTFLQCKRKASSHQSKNYNLFLVYLI